MQMTVVNLLFLATVLFFASFTCAQDYYYLSHVPKQYLPPTPPKCSEVYTPLNTFQYKYSMTCKSSDMYNSCSWKYNIDCDDILVGQTCPWIYNIECASVGAQKCTWKYQMQCPKGFSVTCPWSYAIDCQ